MSRSARVVRLDDYRKQQSKPALQVAETQDRSGRTVWYFLAGMLVAAAIGFSGAYLLGYFGSSVVAHLVS